MNETFTELVQSSKIKTPTQKSFSKEIWEEVYSKSGSSDADYRLYKSGLWVNEKLEKIRNSLSQVKAVKGGTYGLIRLQCSAINFILLSQVNKFMEELQDDCHQDFVLTNIFNFSSSMEGFITAARYPLANSYNQNKSELVGEAPSLLDLSEWLNQTINLGILYDHIEDIWAKCIWHGWYVDDESYDNLDLATPDDLDDEEINTIGTYRSYSIFSEISLHASYLWEEWPEHVKQKIINKPRISAKLNDENNSKLEIDSFTPSKMAGEMPQEFPLQMIAEEIYFNDILEQPLPKLKDLTLRQILESWRLISTLSQEIQTIIVSSTNLNNISDLNDTSELLRYSPTFSKEHLVELVSKTIYLDYSQALTVVDLLTFKGNPRDDLWYRPLIDLGEDDMTMIITCMQYPNLLRSLEQWMREGKLKMDERGFLFENYVRNQLKKENNLTNADIICDSDIFRNADGKEEQIDLVIRIGNKILIGELKCSVYPSSTLEFYNYKSVLADGTNQAKRKANFIRENIYFFAERFGLKNAGLNEIYVYPMVVSNLHLYNGKIINNVPILDFQILSKYFNEGKLKIFMVATQDGFKSSNDSKIVRFYSSEQEAEENIEQYLTDPPQLWPFRERFQYKIQLIPLISSKAKWSGCVRGVIH